jgi:hypothetical protein
VPQVLLESTITPYSTLAFGYSAVWMGCMDDDGWMIRIPYNEKIPCFRRGFKCIWTLLDF